MFGFSRLLLAAALVALAPMAPAASAGPTEVNGPWVSLGDGPQFAPPLNYRPSPYPHTGVSLFVSETGSAETSQCTISWPVRDADGDDAYLTAGHCGETTSDELWIRDRSGHSIPLPPLTGRDRRYDRDGLMHDSALFYLPNGSSIDDPKIAPGVFLRGVMPVEEVRWLKRGIIMCMNGARSGLSCGQFERAYSDAFEWHGTAVHGDSGAPIFVVNGNGDALAVGMLTSGPTDTLNYGTFLEPVLISGKLRVNTN